MVNLATVKQKAAEADAKQGTGGLMTRKVDAAAKTMLKQKVNPNQIWAVVGVFDRSGSMGNEYADGTVQELAERVLAFSVIVDDDGTVPTFFFDHDVFRREIKLNDFHGYLKKNGIRAGGSTGLTEALEAVAKETGNGDLLGGGFFHRAAAAPTAKKAATPSFVVIVTDGRPDNAASARDMIRKLSYRGVFLKFLFVGHDRQGWEFLRGLDSDIPVGVPYEHGGRLIDNVNAQNMGSVRNMSDEEFFSAMFAETTDWLQSARQAGLI